MTLALIQARMGSTRLPGKVLKKLAGTPVIDHVISRVRASKQVGQVIVVTSIDKSNLPLIHHVSGNNTGVFIGSENDVLDRFWQATRLTDAEHIVRITADCPALDPTVADAVIEKHLRDGNDYTTNTNPPTWPDGLDVEVIRRSALEAAWHEAKAKSDREHVTPFIRNNHERFHTGNYAAQTDLSHHRWTIDQAEDFRFLQTVFDYLYPSNPLFGYQDVLTLLEKHPELATANANISRNEGYTKSLKEDEQTNG